MGVLLSLYLGELASAVTRFLGPIVDYVVVSVCLRCRLPTGLLSRGAVK